MAEAQLGLVRTFMGEVLPHKYIEAVNEDPKPFQWHKSADEILASIKRFCVRTLELTPAQS